MFGEIIQDDVPCCHVGPFTGCGPLKVSLLWNGVPSSRSASSAVPSSVSFTSLPISSHTSSCCTSVCAVCSLSSICISTSAEGSFGMWWVSSIMEIAGSNYNSHRAVDDILATLIFLSVCLLVCFGRLSFVCFCFFLPTNLLRKFSSVFQAWCLGSADREVVAEVASEESAPPVWVVILCSHRSFHLLVFCLSHSFKDFVIVSVLPFGLNYCRLELCMELCVLQQMTVEKGKMRF